VKMDKDLSDPPARSPGEIEKREGSHCHARPCAGHPDRSSSSRRDGRDKPGHDKARSWYQPFLFVLAWVFLAVGIVGLFLPFLPGTLFLIAAGACFTRSSPRFEAWLLDHPRFGPPVRQWRATGAIPRRAKIFACVSLAVSWLIVLFTVASSALKIACLAVFMAVAIYVVSRPGR
jgi:uncharacterized membrane protein YbaN (DUF454 family)